MINHCSNPPLSSLHFHSARTKVTQPSHIPDSFESNETNPNPWFSISPEDSARNLTTISEVHPFRSLPFDAHALSYLLMTGSKFVTSENVSDAKQVSAVGKEPADWDGSGSATPMGSMKDGGETVAVRDFDCTLCLKLLYKPTTTICGHSFCKSCLSKSLRHRAKCPVGLM